MKLPTIRLGLQGKFVLLSVGLLLALTVGLTGINIWNQQRIIEQRMFDRANAMASLLAETAFDGLIKMDIRMLSFALDDVNLQEEVLYVYAFDEEGRVLTDGTGKNPHRFQIMQDTVSLQAIAATELLIQLQPTLLDVTGPIYHGHTKIGGIRIGFSLARMHRELNAVRNRNMVFGGVFLLLGMLLTSLMVRRVTSPLSKLMEGIETVAQGTLESTVEVHTQDELSVLAKAFNRMVKDLKHSRDDLVQAKEEAEEMSRLKSAFLANMSHELRTPLTSILGFAQMLSEGTTPEEQTEFAAHISLSGARLMETLNSVLDLAQLQAGKITLDPQPLNLAEAAHEAGSMFRSMAEKKGLALHVQTALPNVPALLDRAAVGRIFNNLIGNAIKFTEHGMVTLEVFTAPGQACLSVHDTGQGIHEDFLPHLFDDFKQESTGHARRHEGNGLGLSITKRLVDLLNGTIAVESEPGQGSTFTIRFPLLEDEPAAPPVSEARLRPARAGRPTRPSSPQSTPL